MNSWSNGEGSHVSDLVLLEIVVEIAVDACAVEVIGTDWEAGGEEEVLTCCGGDLAVGAEEGDGLEGRSEELEGGSEEGAHEE